MRGFGRGGTNRTDSHSHTRGGKQGQMFSPFLLLDRENATIYDSIFRFAILGFGGVRLPGAAMRKGRVQLQYPTERTTAVAAREERKGKHRDRLFGASDLPNNVGLLNMYLENIIMKPTNSPTQGQPNPRKIKVAFWATFFPTAKYFFVGWDWFCIGNRLQQT